MSAFPPERAAGAAALGRLEIPHRQQQSRTVLLASHQDGPSKVGDFVTPPGPWTISGTLSCGRSQQDMENHSNANSSRSSHSNHLMLNFTNAPDRLKLSFVI